MSDASPQTSVPFGRYELLKRLAVGGMAEVFLALDSGTQKLLAIKRILPSLISEVGFIKMFLDEARIAAQLHHPNIVKVYELGKLEESIFLAMEYVDGPNLRRILQREAKQGRLMPLPIAAFIAAEVARGLQYAHTSVGVDGRLLQVVHRDVSPQNVMLGFDGGVKLVDFGIAKAGAFMEASKPGVIKGKFLYLSPEQIRQLPVDHRVDLFALGTLLYEMTTGKSPFLRPSSEQVLKAIRDEDPARPEQLRPEIPADLAEVVLRSLKKDRDQRYASAQEIAGDLGKVLQRHGWSAGRVELSDYLATLFGDENERTVVHVPPTRASLPAIAAPPKRPTRATVAASIPPVLEARPPGLPSYPGRRPEPTAQEEASDPQTSTEAGRSGPEATQVDRPPAPDFAPDSEDSGRDTAPSLVPPVPREVSLTGPEDGEFEETRAYVYPKGGALRPWLRWVGLAAALAGAVWLAQWMEPGLLPTLRGWAAQVGK